MQANGWVGRGRAIALAAGVGVWLLGMAAAEGQAAADALAQTPPGEPTALTLKEFLRRVVEFNESIQLRVLDYEISRRRLRAEKGIFEPELVASYDRQENQRENTSEQQRSLGLPLFDEQNNVYSGGLESLLPTGAKLRLGYTLRDLRNNLQRPFFTSFTNGEYQTFFGASLVQPLLRNGGIPATMANIRVAALASDAAFQDYRRQMMTVVSTAEAAYWNLYLLQQQTNFLHESVALAESILRDNQVRLQAGRGSELEVLEAESGLALRRSRLAEARERLVEAANRVRALYSDARFATNVLVHAVEEPEVLAPPQQPFESWRLALEQNPDVLLQRKRYQIENVRVGYAKNQRLVALDLKAAYGLNGLGDTPSSSWDDIQAGGFPSWSVGVELRVPVLGGIKTRHELEAARLRQQQAALAMREVETQLTTALNTTFHKLRSTRESIANYETVVNFNQNLLQTQLARLELGRVESRKVLEVEADLLEARSALAQAKVQFQQALLELELIQGSLLATRGFEVDPKELKAKTQAVLGRW